MKVLRRSRNIADLEDNIRGVHLEEPSSPLQQQWSTSDLDEFVRQLTNPKHHISKISSSTSSSPMSPMSPTDTCVVNQQHTSAHMTLDSSELCSDFQQKCAVRRSCIAARGKSDSETQTRFRFGRLWRTRQRSSEGDSCDNLELSNCSLGDDGIYDVSEPDSLKSPSRLEPHVTFTCDSSPEGSDTETMTHKVQEEVPACKKETKKRRFRKMLTRPLRRSHSAGCAKDVPAHALFLQHQGESEVDTIESRRLKLGSDSSAEYEGGRRPLRPIHKTSSADAAMMAAEDLPGFTFQTKAKSRGLAKNMKKKLQFLRRRHTDTSLSVTLRNENGKICHIPQEEVQQWSKSFESLLTDKNGLELFKGFLKSEFSEENIEFWIACEQFKTTKANKLNAVAHKIYTDFVAVQAPKEINLDSKTRVKTLGALSQVNRHMFEDAQKRVQALMEKDSYPRFLQSELYQRLLPASKS